MNIQKSYLSKAPTLFLVPTPIGNFDDMTIRAVDILKSVDYIFAEDTRVTKVLLSHFHIMAPLSSYHIFNEEERFNEILDLLKNGHNIALVSDAGMPGISDPGYLVANKAIAAGFYVVALPGAMAGITALVASGLPSDRFSFHGFLSHRKSTRKKELQELINHQETLIFYESPHRIKEFLTDLLTIMGNRPIVIARELTKKYEEYIRGNLSDILVSLEELKGELVVLVHGAIQDNYQIELNQLTIKQHYDFYLKQDFDQKEAMKKVAKDRNVSKSEIYKQLQ
jgi:16S rRNA (cytidine1402-2'-O)-methyltransferase